MELTESGARSRGATPFHFDDIVVDPAAHTLLRAGVPQPVEPKAFAVLLALLQHPGELIGRDDLLDLVWGHRHVTPGVLNRVMTLLRHALGEDAQGARYLHTVHGVGYRFDLPVLVSGASAQQSRPMPEPAATESEPAQPPMRRSSDGQRALPRTALWVLPLLALIAIAGWKWWPRMAPAAMPAALSRSTPARMDSPDARR